MANAGGTVSAPALLVDVNNSYRRQHFSWIYATLTRGYQDCQMLSMHSVILPPNKISILRGSWDLGTMEQSFVKVMFNEREINTWSWSVTNESICAIVMKLGKQNRLDSSGFPLSNCICNPSLAFMCACEWHCFPLGMVGLGPWVTILIHRELGLKSVFYRHTEKDCNLFSLLFHWVEYP